MVMTLTVTNESNRDFTYHGQDRYFLSQGRTIESANKNMEKFLRKEFSYFESEINTVGIDIMDFLIGKFTRWQNGKDTWEDNESWTNQFSDFTFPRHNKAGIVEISQKMFDKIIEEFA